MYTGTNTFMIFIYMQAVFCQYVKIFILQVNPRVRHVLPVQDVHIWTCSRIKCSSVFSNRSAKFQKLVTKNYRDVQHTTYANIKNEIAVIRTA